MIVSGLRHGRRSSWPSEKNRPTSPPTAYRKTVLALLAGAQCATGIDFFELAGASPSHPSNVRPVRRAGAFVVLVDGCLMFYLAQGGRHLLSYGDADAVAMARPLAAGLTALATALKRERQGTFTLERVDDQLTYKSPLAAALRAIGFSNAPKGLTWYG